MTAQRWATVGLAYCILMDVCILLIGIFFLTIDPPFGWLVLVAFGLYTVTCVAVWRGAVRES